MYNKSMQKLLDMKVFYINVGNTDTKEVPSVIQAFKDKMETDNVELHGVLLVPTRVEPTGWAPIQLETLTKS